MLDKLIKTLQLFQTNSDSAPTAPAGNVSRVIVPDNSSMRFLPWNPDDIWLKRWNYDLYENMITDYQIHTLIDVKKNLILGAGFDIENPRDEEGNEIEEASEITAFVYHNFNELYNGSIINDLFKALDSMTYGFSLSELIFDITDDNKAILKKLKTIPPNGIMFYIDEFGQMEKTGLTQRTSQGEIPLPMDKFLYLIWNPKYNNPYGNSSLRSVYDIWFIKKELKKFWAIYMEKFGMPYVVAKYTENLKSQASEMQRLVTQMQASSSAVVPEDLLIEFMEAKADGGGAFERAIEKLDKQIATGLQVPDLLGFSATENSKGSFALGKEQSKTFMAIIGRHRVELQNAINSQVIKKLVDINFPDVKAYPKFVIKEIFKDDNQDKIKTYLELTKLNKFDIPIEHIQHVVDELGFPPAEIIITETPDPVAPTNIPMPGDTGESPQKPQPRKAKPKPSDSKNDEDEKRQAMTSIADVLKFKDLSLSGKLLVEDIINFKAIGEQIEGETAASSSKVSEILIRERDFLVKMSLDKKVVENERLKAIERYAISKDSIGKIKTIFDRMLVRGGLQGYTDSNGEINKQIPATFGVIDQPELSITAAKEFIRAFAKTKAFQMAGDMSDTIERSVRAILIEAIRNGNTTKSIASDLELAFSPYVTGNVIPSSAVSPFRLETIARTNYNTFYNQGRIVSFQQSAKRGIVTHYQFSAILDDHTSEICEETQGTVIPANSETLSVINPPLHFNCRSILLPITKFRVDEMQEGLRNHELKEGLSKPADFYDGFKTKTTLKKP